MCWCSFKGEPVEEEEGELVFFFFEFPWDRVGSDSGVFPEVVVPVVFDVLSCFCGEIGVEFVVEEVVVCNLVLRAVFDVDAVVVVDECVGCDGVFLGVF